MSTDTACTSVDDLLRTADGILASGASTTRGLWPRTAAFLTRMALEQALDELWARSCPGLADCSKRAQLLCLEEYVPPDVARRVAATWTGLSDACHYHTYELAPTVAELRRWHEEASDVVHRLAGGPTRGTG